MKKKLISSLSVIMALMLFISVISASADTIYIYNGYSYTTLDGDYISICGWDNSSEDFVVPAQLDGSFVREVRDNGLKGNTYITSLDLSPAIYMNRVGIMAFKDCTGLTGTLSVPNRINDIGLGAFQGCSNISSVEYYASTDTIPDQCFYNCESLSSVVITEGVASVNKLAFANCPELTNVRIPKSVTYINPSAFKNDTNVVISCYTDSYAREFAEANGYAYDLIDQTFFVGNSLSLKGDIGVNFYLDLTPTQLEQGVIVDFGWDVLGNHKTYSYSLNSNSTKEYGYYKASCPVAVAEMNYDVTATVTVGGVLQDQTDVYSVKDYADYIISNSSDETLVNLIKSMLDYGARAQVMFDRTDVPLANDGEYYFDNDAITADSVTTAPSDFYSGLDAYGLSYYGSSTVLLSKTSIRHYYTITDQALFDAVKSNIIFDGKRVDYHIESDGLIYFEKTDVPAALLDHQYTLTIGSNSYDYSVLDYAKKLLDSDEASEVALAKSLIRYNQTAKLYFV